MAESNFIISSTAATIGSTDVDTKKPVETSELSEEESEITEDSESTDDLGQNSEDEESEESDQQPKEEAEKLPKKKNGFKKRIERFQRQISEKDQEIAFLRSNQKAQSDKGDEKPQATAQKPGDNEPDPSAFDTNAEYIKAYTKWEIKQSQQESERSAAESKKQTAQKTLQSDHNNRLNEFKKAQPDFDDVVADFADTYGDFKASPAVLEALMSSDVGPQVLYEVLKDHDEYERLAGMSEVAVIRELGKIEARIATKSETAKPIVKSKAPAPTSTIGRGTVATAKSLSDPNISFAEYEKIRLQQLKKK